MTACGLLGKKLGHSFSPAIHAKLGDYSYKLCEKEPEEVEEFLRTTELAGLNVTVPYKETVMPFCAHISDEARRIGSVNTLVKKEGGWHGYNTDYFGFRRMIEASGIDVKGKKGLVFGSGGASKAVVAALLDMGAAPVVISRKGEDNYENLDRHRDALFLVQTTPVGMYPGNGEYAADPGFFPACGAAFDVVYNPLRTEFLMRAEKRGMVTENGLLMLVGQAKKSSELFTGKILPDGIICGILESIESDMSNIVLIGMPGCGKSKLGKLLAEKTGRPFYDSDDEIMRRYGMSSAYMIREKGEDFFRDAETEVLKDLGKRTGSIIATGGGSITKERNYPLLHQNGKIVWIRRDLSKLPSGGRPISQGRGIEELYRERKALYQAFCDHQVENNDTDQAIKDILSCF